MFKSMYNFFYSIKTGNLKHRLNKKKIMFILFFLFLQLRINWYLYINHSTVHIHLRKINIIQIIKHSFTQC